MCRFVTFDVRIIDAGSDDIIDNDVGLRISIDGGAKHRPPGNNTSAYAAMATTNDDLMVDMYLALGGWEREISEVTRVDESTFPRP